VKLKNGDHTCTAVILLQKGPPHDLLLGTNLLLMLGFQFIQYENSTGKAVDLLTDERWDVCGEVQKPPGQNTAGILREFKLLSATRVAHHERIIKGQVDIDTSGTNTKLASFNVADNLTKH